MPWIHYVLGCVGLPWATFCGDFAARHILKGERHDDERFYRYFSVDRGFAVPLWAERILGKRVSFVANQAYAKYRQVDTNRRAKLRDSGESDAPTSPSP